MGQAWAAEQHQVPCSGAAASLGHRATGRESGGAQPSLKPRLNGTGPGAAPERRGKLLWGTLCLISAGQAAVTAEHSYPGSLPEQCHHPKHGAVASEPCGCFGLSCGQAKTNPAGVGADCEDLDKGELTGGKRKQRQRELGEAEETQPTWQ